MGFTQADTFQHSWRNPIVFLASATIKLTTFTHWKVMLLHRIQRSSMKVSFVAVDSYFQQSFVRRAATNSFNGGSSLNGKSLFLKPSRSQCVRACVWVCGISYWKKNRVLRSHLMTPSLCSGACNENQGCVCCWDAILNSAHISLKWLIILTLRLTVGVGKSRDRINMWTEGTLHKMAGEL